MTGQVRRGAWADMRRGVGSTGRMKRPGGPGRRIGTAATLASLAALGSSMIAPAGAAAQDPIEIGVLLRTGFRADPASTGESDGFEVFDARAKASGEISRLFDFFMQIDYDTDAERFRLLDAYATVPVLPEVDLSIGLLRPSFGLEALLARGDLSFLERDQASEAIAPGRQVGVSAEGLLLEGRITLGAGIFNGNGRTLENDGNDYMAAGRVQYNSIGTTIAFYDEFVIQVGGSIAYSKDSSADLGRGIVTGDPGAAPELTDGFAGERLLLGGDVKATYRAWEVTAEYLRGEYDLDLVGGGPDELADLDSHGGYAEVKYRAWGLAELLGRYDAFKPAIGESRRFLVFGLNILPAEEAKLGFQYAVGLSDSPDAPTIAGNQFLFLAQVDF
jgi:hypothetical protein